ncbi:MAG: protein kinase domain-containing protein [Polyangiaceae bacterium]
MSGDDEVTRRAEQRIGTVLRGKYHIDRVLGVGGMAVVYAATHRNKKRFAVKMLHPELSIRDDIRTRFLREGYVANSVEHPGAVAVLDDDVAEDGAAFLVMELLDGVAVEQLCEQQGNRLPARVVLALSHQLLDVLAAAHARSIVHRDIKPANVFLTREGKLKVLDFGIARLRDATSNHATNTGMLLGTPAFMAPEQALAQSSLIDGLTDVWAVGATMFSLLSGGIVHVGDNPQQLMVQAATQPARSLATVTQASPRVVALVDRALAFDKASRWTSAAEMRDAVREAYLGEFSTNLSEAPLIALFDPASHSATVQADTVASVGLDRRQGTPAPSAGAGTPSPAMSTPRPPSETPPATYPGASRTVPGPEATGRRWAWLVAAGIGVPALAGGAFMVARAGGHASVGAAGAAAASGSSVTPMPTPSSPSPTAIASAQPAAPEATPASTPTASDKSSAPSRKRSAAPIGAPAAPQAAPPPVRTQAPPPAPAVAVPAPTPHANPLNMGLQ